MRVTPLAAAALLTVAAAFVPMTSAVAAHRAPPENGRIVYSVGPILPDPDLSGASQIWSVRPNGTHKRQLTHLTKPAQAGDPDVSPNGRRILFVSNKGGGAFQVWLMRIDGSHQRQIIDDPKHDAFIPRWAPDGEHLIFTRCMTPFGFIQCTIAQAAVNGTGLHNVTGGHWNDFSSAYSPSGSTIAFSGDRNGFVSAIFRVSAAGGRPHRLTAPTIEAFWPDYRPDGRRILFGDNNDRPHTNTWTMNPDGSHVRQLSHFTDPDSNFGFARFAPSGRKVVAGYTDGSGKNWVATLNADGSGLHKVVRTDNLTLVDWAVKS
jgi:Tol biopolymer transport system component